jgi:glycogen(starch) synthase
MRVLLVSQEVPPETGWGGIGTYVDVLSEALARRGVDVHVLSVVDGQPTAVQEVAGATVHRFTLPAVHRPSLHAPESWRRLLLAVSVARLVGGRLPRPDVVECPEWMAEGLALSLNQDRPLVVRLHSSARQLFPYTGQGRRCGGLDGKLAARLEELSVRRANVVVSTRSNLEEVSDRLRLDPAGLHAIPYPVRLPSFSPLPETGPPRVTFVGRLEARKGPEVVLRAAPGVLAAIPDARFVFVGRDVLEDGTAPSSRWLREEAARLGVGDAIELTGQLDRAGVEQQLQRATVCAFPSKWESFGNVVAEASAVGRPAIASGIPPFRELVADGVTGTIVPSFDPSAWAAAISAVLRDRARARQMGAAAAARVAQISAPGRVAELALAAHEHAIERWQRGQRAGRPRLSRRVAR